jgi:hypothetical protein
MCAVAQGWSGIGQMANYGLQRTSLRSAAEDAFRYAE